MDHLVHEHSRIPAKRQFACDQLEQDHPQRVHIAARCVVCRSLGLFRRHIGGRPQNFAVHGHRDLTGLPLGQTEIHDADPTSIIEHDIAGLQVPVDHAVLMSVLHRVRKLRHHFRSFLG